MALGQGAGQAPDARRRHPDAGLPGASARRRSRRWAPRRRSPSIGERLRFPVVVKPACGGSALGVRFAAAPDEVPAALIAALSYDDTVLLERHVDGRELAVSVLGGEALPIVEAVPRDEDFYDFEARYTIGRSTLPLPGRARRRRAAAEAHGARRRASFELLGCRRAARASTCCSRQATGALQVLEANAIPGHDRDEPHAAGRRGGGHRLRRTRRAPARPRSAR